jgi:hypothetical protein
VTTRVSDFGGMKLTEYIDDGRSYQDREDARALKARWEQWEADQAFHEKGEAEYNKSRRSWRDLFGTKVERQAYNALRKWWN